MRRRSDIGWYVGAAVVWCSVALIAPFTHWTAINLAIAAVFFGLAAWGLRDDR